MSVTELTPEELRDYITPRFQDADAVIAKVNGWLARGDKVAVYVNHDLGHPQAGEPRLVSYGSPQALLAFLDEPPVQLPDTAKDVNWRFRLEAVCLSGPVPLPPPRPEPGTVRADGTIGYAETTQEAMFGIPSARHPRPVWYTAALDNHEPHPRKVEHGVLIEYDDPDGISGQPLYMRAPDRSSIPAGSIFLIDDGLTVRPYYGSIPHPGTPSPVYPEGCEPHELLYPFPVNPDRVTRPDQLGQQRLVDYSNWFLGPRKAYLLKADRSVVTESEGSHG